MCSGECGAQRDLLALMRNGRQKARTSGNESGRVSTSCVTYVSLADSAL